MHPYSYKFAATIRFVAGSVCVVLLSGCTSGVKETNAPLSEFDPDSLQLVEDVARPWGLKSDRVDGISLVVGLPGTGSDPPPSIERENLLTEMRTRDVDKPNQVLASDSTALAVVTGFIPPGARKGDHFDVEVSVPRKSETTSLRSGWLMQARLREYAMVKNRVAGGKVLAHAQGDVIIDALTEGNDDGVMLIRGRILGGGVVLDDRRIGMAIRDGFRSVKTSMRIGEAINKRFHVYHNGRKQGVAVPKDDNFVELLVHPSYRDNLVRYMNVARNVPVRETAAQRSARLRSLRDRLFEPTSAAVSAIQLEAIGEEGIPILREALASTNSEIRFYAAESLAYLNQPEANNALVQLVLDEPAFRWRALTALGTIDDLSAHESLIELMHAESAETRYGAFRVLRKISPDDPTINGRVVGDRFHVHKIRSEASPLVHISKEELPEIVLFGDEHPITTPCVIFAGNEIVVRGNPSGVLTVSRLTAGDQDSRVHAGANVEEMLDAIVEVGGSYSDAAQAINEARRSGCLGSRVAMSAIPELNRTYRRQQESEELEQLSTTRREDAHVDDAVGFQITDQEPPIAEPATVSPVRLTPPAQGISIDLSTDSTVNPPTTRPGHIIGADDSFDNTPDLLFDDELSKRH